MAKNNQNKRNQNDDGNMTVEEAGRKGGEATSANHGREFYEEIGQKGGEARANQRDDNNDDGKMSKEEAGRKGGEARAKQRNND
ncbi:KGG domain-containing protein [Sporosarcina psychrophila]|uniref:KGG domain-containing protein n=1 Tax=Sporosarcina psychrophila TaxID=1476 RepID=UPI00078B1B15|nr:KGG domain-containing protein [Sporosarcina psychrophila]AMQ04996.1 hypothetical protein AZE41_02920 [Sporosarcina psychrophila]